MEVLAGSAEDQVLGGILEIFSSSKRAPRQKRQPENQFVQVLKRLADSYQHKFTSQHVAFPPKLLNSEMREEPR